MKIPTLKKMIKCDILVVDATPAKKVAVKKETAKKTGAKKVAPKKAAAKKAITKKAAVKKVTASRLVVASDSESFWVTSGQVLNSLIALEGALKTMPGDVYAYHISSTGSDFADWVEAVLLAPKCASSLRKAKTANSALVVVTKYLHDQQL